MSTGFPELTDSFLAGQDVFYTQFNDLSFYIEDEDQEHLYFNLFSRLLPNIKLEKIFPLNGKTNVKNHAKSNIGDKSKIYIADVDFDNILDIKEDIENVFYLERYSIENYILEKNGIYELIREKNPKLKDVDIESIFDLKEQFKLSKILLTELSCTFIVIQKYSLGKEYFGLNTGRDFDFTTNPPTFKNNFVTDYLNEVEVLLKNQDGRYNLKSKQREFKNHFRTLNKFLSNVPGKYLINTIKYQLEKLGLIYQTTNETFSYKLSKECKTSELLFLREKITDYIK